MSNQNIYGNFFQKYKKGIFLNTGGSRFGAGVRSTALHSFQRKSLERIQGKNNLSKASSTLNLISFYQISIRYMTKPP